jgi:hypothetical protein
VRQQQARRAGADDGDLGFHATLATAM